MLPAVPDAFPVSAPTNVVAVTEPVIVAPALPVISPPTYNLSPIPTPPLTTNAPVDVELAAIPAIIFTVPVESTVTRSIALVVNFNEFVAGNIENDSEPALLVNAA